MVLAPTAYQLNIKNRYHVKPLEVFLNFLIKKVIDPDCFKFAIYPVLKKGYEIRFLA